MKILRIMLAFAYVLTGMICMASGIALYGVIQGVDKGVGFVSIGITVAYGMMMFGIQSILVMLTVMYIVEDHLMLDKRIKVLAVAMALAGTGGLLVPLVPFGMAIPFSLMGMAAGIFAGAIYGVFWRTGGDG